MRQLDTLIPIAEGASGRVYRSRDRATGQVLAVKRLRQADAGQVARLRREAAAQQRLDHPNICRVFGIEQDDQGHWQLLMDFVPGSTLAREFDRLPLSQRVAILAQVAEAVEVAHQHGILHRDLKPSNILLRTEDDGSLKPVVADFGLARSEDDPAMTATGEVLGTPAYMAPEQALGERERIGPATDVFAIGCMLYEALTGNPPFEAPTISASLDRLLHQHPPHPRKVNATAPRALCRIALQCIERDPSRRYAHARDVALDLARWQQGQSVQARHYSRFYRWRRRIAARPLTTAAGLAGLIVIAGMGGWSLWQASTAAARESLAAELGTTLSDIRNRMHIARLAPRHDIGADRESLGRRLAVVSERHGEDARFADLVQTSLARAYLVTGELEQAARHAEQARAVAENDITRAVWADVLLARYADAIVPIMELPIDRRAERLREARATYLAPAERVLQAIGDPALRPAESLARLAILERRFEAAEELLGRMDSSNPYDYERALLGGRLTLERAAAALEQAKREEASGLFVDAQAQFQRIAATARSDPRPRLLACQAARGRLRATRHQAESLPASLEELEPLCSQLTDVDPGRVSSYAAQSAALAAMAAAWDGINESARARELLLRGIAASERGAQLSPDDPTLVEFRTRLFLRLAGLLKDDFDAAQSILDKAARSASRLTRIEPDNPLGPMLTGTIERDRARQLSLNGRDPNEAFAQATAAFENALALDPDAPAILGEASLNEVFRFYELRPTAPEAAVERARRAIALQQRALDQDPDNVELLFDQGANYGDLWYFLALHPAVAPNIDRPELQRRALGTLARIRELAPRHPPGYTQPIMILLSEAELRLARGEAAAQSIGRALELLAEARQFEIAVDRDLASWIQITRVRSSLLSGEGVDEAIADAWSTMEAARVDRSDAFFRQLYRLELLGLEAQWQYRRDEAVDPTLLERGVETLDALLEKDRRQAIVLCLGARILVYRVLSDPDSTGADAARADRLFDECIESDDDLRARFSRDIQNLERATAEQTAASRG